MLTTENSPKFFIISLSLELHDGGDGEARVGYLVKVVLGQAVVPYRHAQGGGGEGVVSHHGRGKCSKRSDGTVKFVLHMNIVLFLQTPSLLCSTVLKPNFNLKYSV